MTSNLLLQEWDSRIELSSIILKILKEKKCSMMSKEIIKALKDKHIDVPKKIVNSILFSEAKRYVEYDKNTFKYTLKNIRDVELSISKHFKKTVVKSSEHDNAGLVSATLISSSQKFEFSQQNSTGPEFFSVKSIGATIKIIFNERHDFFYEYKKLIDNDKDRKNLKLLELLLSSWAKYEDFLPHSKRKNLLQEYRADWGRTLREMMREDDFS